MIFQKDRSVIIENDLLSKSLLNNNFNTHCFYNAIEHNNKNSEKFKNLNQIFRANNSKIELNNTNFSDSKTLFNYFNENNFNLALKQNCNYFFINKLTLLFKKFYLKTKTLLVLFSASNLNQTKDFSLTENLVCKEEISDMVFF